MYNLLKVFPLLVSIVSFGQTTNNLVPNPSFEDYVNCPTQQGEVGNLESWSVLLETPDAYNVCAPVAFGYSTPWNFRGYQSPSDGDGYIGLLGYQDNASNIREFAGANLISPLVVGETYYASFKVCLAHSNIITDGRLPVAIDKIGIHLSTAWPNYNWLTLPNRAQLYATSVIDDTANWVTISGSFVADSAYAHLALGVFFVDDSLSIIDSDSLPISHAYLFIDEVYVGNNELSLSSVPSSHVISISPNPFIDQFKVKLESKEHWQVQVTDTYGNVVLNEQHYGDHLNINFEKYNSGMYIITIEGTSESIKRRIIKL